MGITVDWDDKEQSTLHSVFTGKWTWDEYNQLSNRTAELTKNHSQPVNVIADFTGSDLLPQQALSGFKKSLETSPMNVGIMVLVSHGTFLPAMIDIFSKFYRKVNQKLFVARSVEEAREIIAKHM